MRPIHEGYSALYILTGGTGTNGGTDTIHSSSLGVTPGMRHHVTTVLIATVGTSPEGGMTGVTTFIGAAYIRCGRPSVTICLIGHCHFTVGAGTRPAVCRPIHRSPLGGPTPGVGSRTPLDVATVRALILPLTLVIIQWLVRLTVSDNSQALLGETGDTIGNGLIVLGYKSVLMVHPFCCTTLRADILLLRIRTAEVAVVVSRIPVVILSLPVIGVTGVTVRQPIVLGFIPGDLLPLVLPRIERMVSRGSFSLGFLGAGTRAVAGRSSRSLMLGFGNLPPCSPSGGVVMVMGRYRRTIMIDNRVTAISTVP